MAFSTKATTTLFLVLAVLSALCLTTTHAAPHTEQTKIENDRYHVWGEMSEKDMPDNTTLLTSINFYLSDPNAYLVDVTLDLQCLWSCHSEYVLFDNKVITANYTDNNSEVRAILPKPMILQDAAFRYHFTIQLARRDATIPFTTPLYPVFRFVWSNGEYRQLLAEGIPLYGSPDEANNNALAYVGKNQRDLVVIADIPDPTKQEEFQHLLHIPTVYNPQHIPITQLRVSIAGSVWDYAGPRSKPCFINGVQWGEMVVEWSVEQDRSYFLIQQTAATTGEPPQLHHNHGMPMRIDCPGARFFPLQNTLISRSKEIGRVSVQLSGAAYEHRAFDTIVSPKTSVNKRVSQGSQITPTPPVSSAVRLSIGAKQQDETTKTTKSSLLTTLYWVSDKVDDLNDVTFFAVFTNAFRPSSTTAFNTLSIALPELSSTWKSFPDYYRPEAAPKQHVDKYRNNVIHYTTGLQWLNDTTIAFKATDAFTTVFTSTKDVQELFLSLEAHVEYITPRLGLLPNTTTVTWYYSAPCKSPGGVYIEGTVCTYLAPTHYNTLLQPTNTPTITTLTQHVQQSLNTALDHHAGLLLGGDVTKTLPNKENIHDNDKATNTTTNITNMTLTINVPSSLVFTLPIRSGGTKKHCSYWVPGHPIASIFGTVTMGELLEPMNGATIQPFRELLVEFDTPPPAQWQGHVRCAAVNVTKAWGVDDVVVDKIITGGEYMFRWDVVTTTTSEDNGATTTTATTTIYTGAGVATPWAKPTPSDNKSHKGRWFLFFFLFALLFIVVFFLTRHIIAERRKKNEKKNGSDPNQPMIAMDDEEAYKYGHTPPPYQNFN